MLQEERLSKKLVFLLISILLCSSMILLYFLDTSLAWGVEKIISCFFVTLWIFFIPPSLRRAWLLNQDKSMAEWAMIGYYVVRGICFPILLAPYNGVRYYFIDYRKNKVTI